MVKERMFSTGSGTRQGTSAIKQDKEIEDIQVTKGKSNLSFR